jgi:enamine deaminase RidA (YjgF/YER057c/UK114 family)
VLFYSGFTSGAPTLEEQVPDILRTLANALAVSGASWSKVVKLSILLERTQNLEGLWNLLAQTATLDVPEMEVSFVDGFAGEDEFDIGRVRQHGDDDFTARGDFL